MEALKVNRASFPRAQDTESQPRPQILKKLDSLFHHRRAETEESDSPHWEGASTRTGLWGRELSSVSKGRHWGGMGWHQASHWSGSQDHSQNRATVAHAIQASSFWLNMRLQQMLKIYISFITAAVYTHYLYHCIYVHLSVYHTFICRTAIYSTFALSDWINCISLSESLYFMTNLIYCSYQSTVFIIANDRQNETQWHCRKSS